MSFECTLDGNGFDANVFPRGSSHIVTTRIGIDDEENRIYSILVALDPLAGGAPGDYEIIFNVTGLNPDTYEEVIFWSGKETRHFIIGDAREKILMAIITCCVALVRTVQPSYLFMATHDAPVPQNALQKYLLIATAIEECGYQIHMPDSYHGQRNWFMERI